MAAKKGISSQNLNKNAIKNNKEEQKLREKLQTLFQANNGTTKSNGNSKPRKIYVQNSEHNEISAQKKLEKPKPINIQKKAKSPEIAKKPKINTKKKQQKAKTATSKKENMSKLKQSMKGNTKSDKKKAAIKRTATGTMLLPTKKRKQQDCEKFVPQDESSSDIDYYLNPEEEERANIVDDYLEKEMNYEDYSEEEMDEEEEEEEQLNYSDFDEDDYEEEDDSYSYSDDNDFSFDSSQSVYSYEDDLETAEDDLIIHKGTAIKRALEDKDGTINFDSDNEGVQIVELEQSQQVKVIKQASAYDRDILIKLSKVERDFTLKLNVNEDEETDCPRLIPIVKNDKEQETTMQQLDVTDEEMEIYYDDEEVISDDSCESYEECDSDDWSYTSESISAKYDAKADLHDKYNMPVKMQAHVINAVGSVACDKKSKKLKSTDKTMTESELTPSALMERRIEATQNKAVIITKPVHEHNMEDDENNDKNISVSQSINNNLNINDSLLDSANNNSLAVDESMCETNLIDNTTESIQQAPEVSMPKRCPMKTRIYTTLLSNRYVLAVLKDTIYFYGTIRFKLLAGALEVYGYQPQLNKEYELFSPRGCSAVNLVPMPTQSIDQAQLDALWLELKPEFDAATLEKIKKSYDQRNDAIVMLQRNDERARLIMHFRRYMNENVFPNIKTEASDKPLVAAEQLLNCYINKSSAQALQIPSEWQKLPLLTNMRLLLAGGKGVGKSTLLRYLVNRLLSKNDTARQNGVLLIDLDIGQSELCAPETISCTLLHRPLLGPGFFLNQPADCSYLVGQVNVILCAQRYLRAVQLLIEHCKNTKAYEGVPWLINTMGYNQGIGLELIAAICEILQPTHVVQIQSQDPINNFSELLEPSILRSMEQEVLGLSALDIDKPLAKYTVNNFTFQLLPAAVMQTNRYQREWNMSAKDMRYAILLAQMSDILLDQSTYLCERAPYCAALTDIKVRSLNDPSKTLVELQQALTANMVYLCQQDSDETKPMKCFGIGIVRSLDEKLIYIMSAAALENIQGVNCLVLSEQPLPTANLKQQGVRVEETYLPFVYASNAHASTAVKQIYRRPAEFQTGQHRELLA